MKRQELKALLLLTGWYSVSDSSWFHDGNATHPLAALEFVESTLYLAGANSFTRAYPKDHRPRFKSYKAFANSLPRLMEEINNFKP